MYKCVVSNEVGTAAANVVVKVAGILLDNEYSFDRNHLSSNR